MTEIPDEAIIYQLEKITTDISGPIEEYIEDLAEQWDYEFEEDEANPHYGDLKLPDGRYVVWALNFEIQSVEITKPT